MSEPMEYLISHGELLEAESLKPADVYRLVNAENHRELEAQLAEAVSLFKLVMEEHPGKERNGNAPGHAHQIPGIWDSDNGKKAGKPCAWCAVWNNAHEFLARHGDKS